MTIKSDWRNKIEKIKHLIAIIIAGAIEVCVVVGFVKLINYTRKLRETRYELEEVESGIYAICYRTQSSIPAQNYDVITFCSNGNIYTFDGEVSVSYTEENPYAIVEDYVNCAHGATVYIYVPKGSVKRQENAGIG